MSYKQLIEGQRYQIQVYLHEGLSYREIAKKLGISHTTVSREIRRNHINDCVYDPKHAQIQSLQRRFSAKKRRISSTKIAFVEFGLSLKWSPEQISGVASLLQLSVSHEWIYNFIRLDKHQGGKLFKQLRCGHKRYRKGSRGKRVIIPNRVGIEHRPKEVDNGERFGD